MSTMLQNYDVIVIGAGHAGCEAAVAAARMGTRVLLITTNLQKVATLPCNPSIGGPGKGHLVREIGALGGIQAEVADKSAIQIKELNTSKGPAVRAYRAQLDKTAYNQNMLAILTATEGLDLLQDEVKAVVAEKGIIGGVRTAEHGAIGATVVVVCGGTFLNGEIIIGDTVVKKGGRIDEKSSEGLTGSLLALGLKHGRLKTGTPPRIARDSVDYSVMERSSGDGRAISFCYPDQLLLSENEQEPCYLTYTTPQTHQLILDNLTESPIFSGMITERAPRSCPSLDRKVANFPERPRHPIFIEPEGRPDGPDGDRMYIQGGSLAFPAELQERVIRTIPGLEKSLFLAPGYAVVYDFFLPHQLRLNLETKVVQNLFLAGQMNGTTGYEEAAAQGLMAGINAARKVQSKPPFILDRTESYIGVLIEDLVTKIHVEPYRMFTSRAEYRLLLRNDNADVRLSRYGYELGLINQSEIHSVEQKIATLEYLTREMTQRHRVIGGQRITATQYLTRPENGLADTIAAFGMAPIAPELITTLTYNIKYAGYFDKQRREAEKLHERAEHAIPATMDIATIPGLRNEARIRLQEVQPTTLAQAQQIQGVTPADLSILMVAIHAHTKAVTL